MNASLETDRLSLRPFRADDAEGWHAIWGDPEVIWWGASPSFEKSRASLLRLIEAERETWPEGIGWLAVREKGAEDIVGDVLIQPARFVDGIEVGWHMRTHVWRRGYATESVRATVERGFREGHYDAVWAVIETSNAPSLRVAEKLGMELVRPTRHAGLPHHLFVWRAPRSPGPRAIRVHGQRRASA